MLVGRAATVPAHAGPHPVEAAPVRGGNPWGGAAGGGAAAGPAMPQRGSVPPVGVGGGRRPGPTTTRRVPATPTATGGGGLGDVLQDVLTGGRGKRQGVV